MFVSSVKVKRDTIGGVVVKKARAYAISRGYTLKTEGIPYSIHTTAFLRNRGYTVILKKIKKVYDAYHRIPSITSLDTIKTILQLQFD